MQTWQNRERNGETNGESKRSFGKFGKVEKAGKINWIYVKNFYIVKDLLIYILPCLHKCGHSKKNIYAFWF